MGVEIRFVRRHRSVTAAVQVDAPASKPDLALHNTIVRAGAHHAFTELEPRLARLIEPVLRDAGDRAAKEFTRLSNRSMVAAAYRQADRLRIGGMGSEQARTLLRSLSLTSAAPPDLKVNSTMICVKPTPEQAKAVGGDENTHVTLVYLGEYDGDLNRLAEILGPVAASHAPLNGEVAGDGEFGPLVQILLPDVPGLVELRVAVTEALMDGGQTYATEHGYLSHMTREYLPGAYPPEVNFRVALAATLPHCGTCSYWEGRGFCAMFGADARLDNVCDEWTQVPPPAVPFGAPLDFTDLLIVRGDTEVVALPLVGSPPLTAAGAAVSQTRSTQSAQTAAEAQAQATAQEAEAQAAAEALQDAMSEMTVAQRELELARKSGDPERITTAERALKIANERVTRALQAVNNPEEPPETPEPEPVTPPVAVPPSAPTPTTGTPVTSPIQIPTTVKGQVAPPTDVPSAVQVTTQGQTQEIFTNVPDAPEAAKNPAIGGTLADIEKGIEEAGFVARPTTEALERIEEVKPLPPQFQIPAGDELLDTRALAAQVRGVTDPVRQAVVRQVGEPIVQGVGLQWDEANPFSAKVLAQSASQITSISETTQANVMQIIQDAHDNGWSVPVTAKAIQQGMRDASPERATLIARTELAGAVNGGSLAATQIVQSATGVQYAKVWTTAPGARYPRHENYPDLNGQVQNSLDGTFQVGDAQLRYPGDPDGPPEEVCNCRCTLIYQEVDDSAAPEAAPEGTPTPTAEAAPAATMPTIQTSDPAYAAQALANGDRVVLNQPNELSTFIDDLGAKAAAAQAAGEAAPTLDLGDVTVKGTNLFTQDSLGIPRIDMPQLSGTPLPGSLAANLPKIPGGYEGDPNQVNIGPLFYQSLRDRGVKVTEEDVLASHLKPTQDQINGGQVAKIMDGLENGTMTERRIPISSDNYIVDGHHQWAATIGADWKTGTDAGLTIPVDRIDEPITTILDQANAFAKKYGIPQQSVDVPPVKDAEVAAVPATDRDHPDLVQKGVQVPADAVVSPAAPSLIPGTPDQAAGLQQIRDELAKAKSEGGIVDEATTQDQATSKTVSQLDRLQSRYGGTLPESQSWAMDTYAAPSGDNQIQTALRDGKIPKTISFTGMDVGDRSTGIPSGATGAELKALADSFTEHGLPATFVRQVPNTEVRLDGQQVVGLIDKTIADAPGLESPVTVYRGLVHSDALLGSDPKIGDLFTEKGYTSGTVDRNIAVGYANGDANTVETGAGGPPAVYRVTLPDGYHAYWNRATRIPDPNYELTLPRGVTMRIDKIDTTSNGTRVIDAHLVSVDEATPPKDPILGITPFRAGEDNPLGFYDTAKAKQFEADLKTEAVADHLTIQSSDHVTGVWQGDTEPSYSVHVLGDQADVATFAEHMRAKYDQDGVMVFTPKADMPAGMTANAAEYTISGVKAQDAIAALSRHGFDGATVLGDRITIVGEGGLEEGAKATALAKELNGSLSFKEGHVAFVDRPAEAEPRRLQTGGKPIAAPAASAKPVTTTVKLPKLDPLGRPDEWSTALAKAGVPDDVPVPLGMGTFTWGGVDSGSFYNYGPAVVWKKQGVIVRAELPTTTKDTPAVAAAKMQQVTDTFFQDVPASVSSSVKNINIFNGQNPQDGFWAKQFDMPGFVSGAASANGTMTFWNNDNLAVTAGAPEPPVTKDTFDHEIGHLRGDRGGALDEPAWIDAANADSTLNRRRFKLKGDDYGSGVAPTGLPGEAFLVGTRGISDYGGASLNEDWAETMRLYLAQQRDGTIGTYEGKPVTFDEMFPNRAREFEKELNLPALGPSAT